MKYLKGLLLCLSFVFLLAGMFRELGSYDEGLSVYAADRVARGEAPYRDFWVVYPPGEFYTLAALFKTFGYSILVERIWDTCVRWALALLVYVIARRVTSPLAAIFPWTAAVLLLGSCGGYAYPVFPALSLSLAGSLCMMNFLSRDRPLWLTLSGACIGLAAIYRQDFGLYTGLAVGSVLTCFAFANRRSALKLDLTLVKGILIPVVPVALYFVAVAPLADLWSQLFTFAITTYRKARYLPGPPFLPASLAPGFVFRIWAQYYTPLAVDALACAAIVRRYLRGWSGTWEALLLTLLGILFCLLGAVRVDSLHLVPAALTALILSTALLFESRGRKRLVGALALAWLSTVYMVMPARSWLATLRSNWPPPPVSRVDRARYFHIDPDLEEAILFVRSHVPPDDTIYVGSVRHDRVFVNDILFYFLSGRHSASRYHDLTPAVFTTAPVQEEVIQALRMKGTKYLVLFGGYQIPNESNESGRSGGSLLLDNFIAAHFSEVRRFGLYQIWQRSN